MVHEIFVEEWPLSLSPDQNQIAALVSDIFTNIHVCDGFPHIKPG